jgi:hypothetical protein
LAQRGHLDLAQKLEVQFQAANITLGQDICKINMKVIFRLFRKNL